VASPTDRGLHQLVSVYGINRRHHGADAKRTRDAHRDLAAARIERYMARVLSEAPPLLPEQRDRLALLLRGASPAITSATRSAAQSAA
jgi:hypothetical protein